MIDNEVFLTDFCDTMGRKNLVVEITRVEKNKVTGQEYYKPTFQETITPQQIKNWAKTRQNINILGSVTAREFGNGRAGKRDIQSKNHLIFDLDLKDSIKNFEDRSTSEKKHLVRQVFEDCKNDIESCGLGHLWFACYSGNGLHLWFRSSEPIPTDDSKRYELFYLACLAKLEKALKLNLDHAFKTPAQLIRLPLSLNCKDESNIIQTEILYHNAKADSSRELVAILKESINMELIKHAQVVPIKTETMRAKLDEDSHKESLRSALTFDKILQHRGLPNYSQGKPQGEWFLIPSPWKNEKNPSCNLNIGGKYFKDRSANKEGDIFDFIAELHNLNIKADFLKVLKIAEEITGIPSPKAEKAKRGKADDSEEKKKITRENYYTFFEKQLPNLCTDILTGQMFFKDKEKKGAWAVAMNALLWLEAESSESGLKHTMVGRWLTSYGRECLKPRLLVDIPEWDGKDRIKQIASCVHIKKDTGLNQEHFEEFLKQWGARIFERLDDSLVQNPLLLLVGGQGIGKDFLIQSMVGGLGRYYAEGSIGRKAEDDYQTMARSLVINLAEFDRTAQTEVGYLKDLIYKPQATFRQPYARQPESVDFHCSWIASSNETDLLRDASGNRRFVIFEIEKIDHSYPTDESLQILAQFKALKGKKVSPEARAAMDIYIKEKTPPTIEEQVLDVFDNLMNSDFYRERTVLTCNAAHGVIAEVAKTVRQSTLKVTRILSKAGRSRTGSGRRREVFLPENNR